VVHDFLKLKKIHWGMYWGKYWIARGKVEWMRERPFELDLNG